MAGCDRRDDADPERIDKHIEEGVLHSVKGHFKVAL